MPAKKHKTGNRSQRAQRQKTVRVVARRAVRYAKAGRCGAAKIDLRRAYDLAVWHAFSRSRRLALATVSSASLKVAQLCVG